MSVTRRTALAAIAALAGAKLARAQDARLPVAASFSILADFVKAVGGARVDVATLVAPGSDVHVYEPTPEDARKLGASKLIFINGLGLEGWMERLAKAAGAKAPVVVATAGVKPIEEGAEGGRTARNDPHAWQSIANVKIYVANIRDALVAADGGGAEVYRANAEKYLAQLGALEGEARSAIAAIPAARRRIITTHDAFAYFGATYGFAFIAPRGVSTETEASAADVGKIIRQIRAEKIPAVFLENVSDPRLMQRIAKESGAKIGGTLYSDSLSKPDGPAATYLEMVRGNLRELGKALGG